MAIFIKNNIESKGKGNTIQPIPDRSRDSQNRIYSSSFDVSEAFAQFFQNNNSNQNYLNDFLSYKNSNPLTTESNPSLNNPSYDQPFNHKELYSVLQNCNSKSTGLDNIPYMFIQNLPDKSTTILLEIFNILWTQEIFHNQWRIVTIIPIPKPDKNKFELPNYRPISLNNTMSKVLEISLIKDSFGTLNQPDASPSNNVVSDATTPP